MDRRRSGPDGRLRRRQTEGATSRRSSPRSPGAILALPLDPVTSAEAFKPAVASGVKIVLLSNKPKDFVQGKDYVTIVTDDLFQMGKHAADALAASIGQEGQDRLDLSRCAILRDQPARQCLQVDDRV